MPWPDKYTITTLNRLKPNVVSDSALWTIEGNLLFGDDPADCGRAEADRNLATTVKFTVINQNTAVEWSDTIVIGKLTETQVFVGGIDVFAFSEDLDPKTKKSLYTHYVIEPRGKLELPGWHQTAKKDRDDNFLAFLVTEYGRGARSRLFPQSAPDESVGAVTVAISHSFVPGDKNAKSTAETGFGRKIKQDQKPVERVINAAHAFITIRYDR